MDTVRLEDACRSAGFSGLEEVRRLLLHVRMSSPEQRRAYERWAREDGTKDGLLALVGTLDSSGREPGKESGGGEHTLATP
jgi:hypothetical protein